ncbi:thiol reductant ABC exporter subunit CydD [Propionibacteriaceae bacterium G57]|uniref:thiol reductant ABC exporter subunit CydD n=1 Tax=Aestuariimicrobium sp. G57 TaxID=3418485 RepID=UPI003DA7056E
MAASVAPGVVSAALMITQAWLLARGIVGVFETHQLGPVTWVIPALVTVFALRGLVSWVNETLAHRAAAEVKSTLRRDILAARLANPTRTDVPTSTLIQVVNRGLEDLDGYFSKYLPQLGLALVVPLIIGTAILVTDWPSAIIVAFTLPLIPVFMALIGWTTQKAVARRFSVADRLAHHFADLIEGLPTLQAFGRARAQRKGVIITEDANRRETMRTLYVSFLSSFALEFLATLSVAVVAVTIGFRVVYGHVTFFDALFVLVLAPEAFLPVRQVGAHFHDSADGVAAADAAFEIIDHSAPAMTGTAAAPASADIVVDAVSFQHRGAERPAVDAVSLTVHPGEVVALAGPSGSGKTTLLSLVMGFASPTRGQILLGAQPLADTDPDSWHALTAWVPQTPGMVNGTVADNVRLGLPTATDDQVAEALAAASVDFPPDKRVEDLGEGLSSGERRRVAMARAWLRITHGAARWLVLDEPTAGLDADAEAQVLATVRATGAGALVVSHRPAVLAVADRVVELETTRNGVPA